MDKKKAFVLSLLSAMCPGKGRSALWFAYGNLVLWWGSVLYILLACVQLSPWREGTFPLWVLYALVAFLTVDGAYFLTRIFPEEAVRAVSLTRDQRVARALLGGAFSLVAIGLDVLASQMLHGWAI